MKNIFSLLVVMLFTITLNAQTKTATLKSASRLFADKDDLASVQLIVPSGSSVDIQSEDDTYYYVTYEGTNGYIFKRHAVIDDSSTQVTSNITDRIAATTATSATAETSTTNAVAATSTNRLAELQSRYDSRTAKSIYQRKIWKGMNTDMVIDSWGNPQQIDRTIIPDSVKEEWNYTKTWLYFENDILISWGPIKK